MDPALREPLRRPALPASPGPDTIGDLIDFSLAQEAATNVSEVRTQEAVKALDDCTAANKRLVATLGAIKP